MNEFAERRSSKILAIISAYLAILFCIISINSSLSTVSIDTNDAIQTETFEDDIIVGSEAYKDQFPVTSEDIPDSFDESKVIYPSSVLGFDSEQVPYIYTSMGFPLARQDYYYGKYKNAKAGTYELNNIPVLKPGDKISILGDGYLTINWRQGYIRPEEGYLFGSGVCWTVSAFGAIMDKANHKFNEKYGLPLFVFESSDRGRHSHYYETYKSSNRGYGYSVYNAPNGQDYTFRVNPDLKDHRTLSNIRIKIILTATDNHPTAYKGQSINVAIHSNLHYLGYSYSTTDLGPYWEDIKEGIKDAAEKYMARN